MTESEEEKATTPGPGVPSESDVFATLHHLVSQIDTESRVDEVVEKAQGLDGEETQLLVDCLSMALDRDAAPLKTRVHVWCSLIKVASSARVFAQNHTLNSEYISPESDSAMPDTYRISGDASMRVKILKQSKTETDELYTEPLITWVHLSHPNILPLYAVFIENKGPPYLVSPCTTDQNIGDYLQDNPEISRISLIHDVINGLSYVHQYGIVHGALNPESVLISNDGRALIVDPDPSDSLPVRYSAPELLADDEIQPTRPIDMWAFACLCYEVHSMLLGMSPQLMYMFKVLSGVVPFYHITKEFKVAVAIAAGNKPTRPGKAGKKSGGEIGDAIWQIMLMCWEFEPEARPTCLTVQQMFLGMVLQDERPPAKLMVQPEAMKRSAVNLEQARASLTRVLGSDSLPSLRVPEHLRESLSSLVPDTTRLNATTTAAKKLSPNDTQMFVDFLDLVLEDLPSYRREPIIVLLSSIMVSTHIIPHRHKLSGIQYDPIPMFEGPFAKVHKGRGLNIRVNAVTSPWLVKGILATLPDWSHVSHPNINPFYGVFHEGVNDSLRLFVVTSLWSDGSLEDYAPALPQKSRLPLISDVIDGLAYLEDLGIGFIYYKKEHIMISAEGRAVLSYFATDYLLEKEDPPATRELRFKAPNVRNDTLDEIWTFGCFCYMVLSRKLPYYQFEEGGDIQEAVLRGELPRRPDRTDDDMDEIDDKAWHLITRCCEFERSLRPTAPGVKGLIADLEIEDNRPPASTSPEAQIFALRSRSNVDFPHVETLIGKIQAELLRSPLSKLLQNHIKDVTKATADLDPDDTRTLVDYLDLTLKDHLSISEEQNRVLALLSRVTSSTHIFPRRYELKGIKYHTRPMAEGGYGTVHRGTDIDVCVKVMTQVDHKALTPWIRELILWAHASHPNILPFCGVLLEDENDSQRICLVSPFMKNGNLHNYAPHLPQKSRLPLILDVANGLHYLHVLGILHGDLKGENILISDEGRCLITDFGTTQITTATVTTTTSLVPTTLRFAAPEVVLTSGPPTQERDIWAFGCLCYEVCAHYSPKRHLKNLTCDKVLTRQLPYYQYAQTVQVSAALARKELPKRPGSGDRNAIDESNDDDWDDDDEEDLDEIDDQAWGLITKCCAPQPEDRLKTAAIQELIVDMKIWDDRPATKAILGTEISKLRANPEIDLNRVGELLDQLQKSVVPSEEGVNQSFVDAFMSLWE
ncbi:hypothetical protein D9756_002591 [Leucocoprinus leucothites]|uniref:Protein kinase domain-containing protein n=1 Tax=Leucocoprinus leucothites TaxID=201217 RepID=A0A8H5GBV8_9AGAR|nr:hypothetical protein D9756_002591 [Leucoagaricus leucothites]